MASAGPRFPPGAAARLLVDLARSRPATLGTGRLIRLDGPAGSGKTTLAAAVAELVSDAHVVHMDDLYDGWGGLPRVADQLDSLLVPLAAGKAGSYRRYDWLAGEYAETVVVPPTDLLVLEGVGSGSRAHTALATVTAWVWAPEQERRARGLERDGPELQEQWRRWMQDEDDHFASEAVAENADVLVDGLGVTPPVVRPAGSRSAGCRPETPTVRPRSITSTRRTPWGA